MPFSAENQPTPEQRIHKVCNKSLHDMTEGSPNVLIEKTTKNRRCRACAADTRKAWRDKKQELLDEVEEIKQTFASGQWKEPDFIEQAWDSRYYQHAPIEAIEAKIQVQMAELKAERDEVIFGAIKGEIVTSRQWIAKKKHDLCLSEWKAEQYAQATVDELKARNQVLLATIDDLEGYEADAVRSRIEFFQMERDRTQDEINKRAVNKGPF